MKAPTYSHSSLRKFGNCLKLVNDKSIPRKSDKGVSPCLKITQNIVQPVQLDEGFAGLTVKDLEEDIYLVR